MTDRPKLVAGGIIVVYLLLAGSWSYVIPLGGGIDEPRHLRYLQIVAEEGRIPGIAEKQEAISHHPPLHYLLAAPLYLATDGLDRSAQWHILRLFSVLIGAGGIIAVYAMLRRAVPSHPWVAPVGMAAVGWLPHYLLVSAMFANDVTAAAAGALVLYLSCRAVLEPDRRTFFAALAGLAAGLGVAAKMNVLLMLPAPASAIALAPALTDRNAGAEGRPLRTALRSLGGFLGAFAVTGGAVIAWHLQRWGRLESDPPWPEAAWPVHTLVGKFVRAIDGLYRSTWAQVGWLPGPHSPPPPGPTALWPRPDLETPLLALAAPLTIVAIIGGVALAVRWLRSEDRRSRGLVVATLLATAVTMYAGVTWNAIFVNPGRYEGGRYLLPAVAAYMSIFALGPLVLTQRWRRLCWVALPVLLLVLNAVSFWEMLSYLIPTFAP